MGPTIDEDKKKSEDLKRKQPELRLEESEDFFRTIIEESHLGITILQDDQLAYVNHR